VSVMLTAHHTHELLALEYKQWHRFVTIVTKMWLKAGVLNQS